MIANSLLGHVESLLSSRRPRVWKGCGQAGDWCAQGSPIPVCRISIFFREPSTRRLARAYIPGLPTTSRAVAGRHAWVELEDLTRPGR